MAHDDIPEDVEQSFPCECGGVVRFNEFSGLWECDTCDLAYVEEAEVRDV